MTTADDRLADLEERLAVVEQRVLDACSAAGRPRDEVTVVAVTKTFPVTDVALLHRLGVRDVGENRDGDAADKAEAARGLGLDGLRWHFVGQVQRNKARSVAAHADLVHSVDRVRLVAALDTGAEQAGRRLGCLVQVDLREPPVQDGRGGSAPAEVSAVADAIAGAAHLDLLGVMAVAPLGEDAGAAFARLSTVADRLRADHPDAAVVSAGMSADLEAAVDAGATHLRIGTALLGSRPPLG